MKYGLKEVVIKKICDVFRSYPQVDRAILYGSRAKGTFKPGSDIDLSLCGGDDLTHRFLLRITEELEQLQLPYTIDLSLFDEITDADVKDHIDRVGVVFHQK